MKAARWQLAQALGIAEESFLDGKFRMQHYPPGYVLTEQGSTDISLFYVLSGSLELLQKFVDEEGKDVCLIDIDFVLGLENLFIVGSDRVG